MCVKRWKLDEFQKKNMKKTRRGHRKKGMLFFKYAFFFKWFFGMVFVEAHFRSFGIFSCRYTNIYIYDMCRYAHVTLTFGRFTGKMMAFRLPA